MKTNDNELNRQLTKGYIRLFCAVNGEPTATFKDMEDLTESQLEELRQVLVSLNPREEKILDMRFGLKDGQNVSLEEISRELRLTRERVRYIEEKALRKLRHPYRNACLRQIFTQATAGKNTTHDEPDKQSQSN